MGPLGRVALLASLAAGLAVLVAMVEVETVEVAALWVGIRGGGLCNTTLSWQLPTCFLHLQRNCMGPLDQRESDPDAVVATCAVEWAAV